MIKDTHISPIVSAGTWSGAFLGGVGALTLTQWLAIGGFLLALAGFFVNLWHKRQILKIEARRLELEFPAPGEKP